MIVLLLVFVFGCLFVIYPSQTIKKRSHLVLKCWFPKNLIIYLCYMHNFLESKSDWNCDEIIFELVLGLIYSWLHNISNSNFHFNAIYQQSIFFLSVYCLLNSSPYILLQNTHYTQSHIYHFKNNEIIKQMCVK